MLTAAEKLISGATYGFLDSFREFTTLFLFLYFTVFLLMEKICSYKVGPGTETKWKVKKLCNNDAFELLCAHELEIDPRKRMFVSIVFK